MSERERVAEALLVLADRAESAWEMGDGAMMYPLEHEAKTLRDAAALLAAQSEDVGEPTLTWDDAIAALDNEARIVASKHRRTKHWHNMTHAAEWLRQIRVRHPTKEDPSDE